MSYHAFGDNEDLANLPDDAYERLVPLGNLIEASHQEACGCTESTCWTREHHGRPSTEEVLGWLVAKGLMTLAGAEAVGRGGPRIWRQGDPEPRDNDLTVRTVEGKDFTRDHVEGHWVCAAPKWFTPDWSSLVAEFGPVTEVIARG